MYDLDYKNPESKPESKMSGEKLAEAYKAFIAEYPSKHLGRKTLMSIYFILFLFY